MLSILIPTYNYNVYPLVKELEKQALQAGITFELICIDDGSFSILNEENQKINSLTNCTFIENKKNIGRSAIRNLLAEKATYNLLLFFDADVMPVNNNLILEYIKATKAYDFEVFYGGLLYQANEPEDDKYLRWNYGTNREALNFEKRKQKPYASFITMCFLVKKSVFKKVRFNEEITLYGYEDLLFAQDLKSQNIRIKHIDNPVYHLGIDDNQSFLEKTQKAVQTLNFLLKNKLISYQNTKITKAYYISKTLFINKLLAVIFKKYQTKIETKLVSRNASLFLFDFYRLCYLCFLDNSK